MDSKFYKSATSQMQAYHYNKTIQAKLSAYGRLNFLEIGPNLLQIHLVLDFHKTE